VTWFPSAAGIQVPGVIDNAHMWVTRDGKDALQKVGVWVICCGIQADGPMRQLLTRSLAPAAERGCDCCGILARKGSWNATKYLGCDAVMNMSCVLYIKQRRIQGSVVRHKMLPNFVAFITR
jgi:hypothetical protein